MQAVKTVGTTADRIRSFVHRVERLEEDKGEGFDVKVLRKVVTLRRKDPEERAEEDELVELYMAVLDE